MAISAQQKNKAELIYQIHSTITHYFPDLFDWMRDINDCRKKDSKFELSAHLTDCLAMFIFKAGSRNEYNQRRKNLQFQKNYKKLFGFPMSHGDSVISPSGADSGRNSEIPKFHKILLISREVLESQNY